MATELKTISKEELVARLHEIARMGWIRNRKRVTNDGAAGNMLEDLLGIPENNLPIPNAAEWELKTQRLETTALLTLFHQEPSPLALRMVSSLLLPAYGWPHAEAGRRYAADELSFRATLACGRHTRGFTIEVNDAERKVCVTFDAATVRDEDTAWLNALRLRGTDVNRDLAVTPYWGFDDLFGKARTKLRNSFLVLVETKSEKRATYFHVLKAYMLKNFSLDRFIDAIRQGKVYIDFDARTGHNHGTKFRVPSRALIEMYAEATVVVNEKSLK